jgi:membrane protein
MLPQLDRLKKRLFDPQESTALPRPVGRAGRLLWVLARDLVDGQLTMRAMSLVYTTLLSLVPLLALSFSVLKALGVHNSMEPLLAEALAPLGERAADITANIIGFVENVQVGVLGSLGVALLFYAAVSMIQKVENSFNFIWRIDTPRPFSQRVGEYLAVLTVGPVLIFSALGVTASLLSSDLVIRLAAIEPFGYLVGSLTRALPYVLVIGAFTFVYTFIPNTRVRILPALAGGITAGVLWQSASLIFASFVAGTNNYSAVYSGFAIFLFLLIWLYVGWLILLIGCQLAFYLQNPNHIRLTRIPPHLASRAAEYIGLSIMVLVTRAFVRGEAAPTTEMLIDRINAAPEHVHRQLGILTHHGLLAPTGTRDDRWLPAIDPGQVTLSRLWRLVRAGTEPQSVGRDPVTRDVIRLLDEAEHPFEAERGGMTLRALVLEEGADPSAATAPAE